MLTNNGVINYCRAERNKFSEYSTNWYKWNNKVAYHTRKWRETNTLKAV